jgi:hypothetical protein
LNIWFLTENDRWMDRPTNASLSDGCAKVGIRQ